MGKKLEKLISPVITKMKIKIFKDPPSPMIYF